MLGCFPYLPWWCWMNPSTSCRGSSTCKNFTFPVSPKHCLYRSQSLMMIRSCWAKYFAALIIQKLGVIWLLHILSLSFLMTGSWSWCGLRLRGKLMSWCKWRHCSCSGSWIMLQTNGKFSGCEFVLTLRECLWQFQCRPCIGRMCPPLWPCPDTPSWSLKTMTASGSAPGPTWGTQTSCWRSWILEVGLTSDLPSVVRDKLVSNQPYKTTSCQRGAALRLLACWQDDYCLCNHRRSGYWSFWGLLGGAVGHFGTCPVFKLGSNFTGTKTMV